MHFQQPLALSCLDFCQLNIHAEGNKISLLKILQALGNYKMISSTALPKVTFNRAPMVSPSSLATLSVA